MGRRLYPFEQERRAFKGTGTSHLDRMTQRSAAE
jgi:hypothetical protein